MIFLRRQAEDASAATPRPVLQESVAQFLRHLCITRQAQRPLAGLVASLPTRLHPAATLAASLALVLIADCGIDMLTAAHGLPPLEPADHLLSIGPHAKSVSCKQFPFMPGQRESEEAPRIERGDVDRPTFSFSTDRDELCAVHWTWKVKCVRNARATPPRFRPQQGAEQSGCGLQLQHPQ